MMSITSVQARPVALRAKLPVKTDLPRFGVQKPLNETPAGNNPTQKRKGTILAYLATALASIVGITGGNAVINNAMTDQRLRDFRVENSARINEVGNRITWDHLVEAARLITPSTVKVSGPHGTGSGVILEDSQGRRWIMTNAHVVENRDNQLEEGATFRIRLFNGSDNQQALEFDAKVHVTADGRNAYSASTEHDLAILEIPASAELPAGLQTIKLRDLSQNPLKVGEVVLAVGAPHGLADTVTAGIISHIDRNFSLEPQNKFIQHSAPINPGNSGGGLYTIRIVDGRMVVELVGINTLGYRGADGLAGAIRTEILQQFLRNFGVH